MQSQQATVAQQSRRLQALEARRQLHIAVVSLEARNFGTAQQHIQQASDLLRQASQPSDRLHDLATSLSKMSLVASEDVGMQRQRLMRVIQQTDEALASSAPKPSPP